jgi:membrane protease YdiL (CAAX protease family)
MKHKYLGLLIVISYLLLRMGLEAILWSKLHPYYSYGFEILFVAAVALYYRQHRPWFLTPQKRDLGISLLMILAGILTYEMAGVLGMGVPYDLDSLVTIIFLLLVAPILEELIFRLALWEALKSINGQALLPIIGSTVLFSLGHLVAYWVVPSSIQPFVLYQSLYVIPLSIVISYRRHYARSVMPAILLHFGFNLGFLLASKI